MNLSQRTAAVFKADVELAFADDYAAVVRENWRECEQQIRRSFFLIVLLAIFFELAGRGGVADFSLGFFSVSNPSVIRAFIPLAISLVIYFILSLTIQTVILKAVHDHVMEAAHMAIWQNDLEQAMTPGVANFYGPTSLQVMKMSKGAQNVVQIVGLVRLAVIILLPIVFVAYAYVSLFTVGDVELIGLAVSLGLAILCVGLGIVTFVTVFLSIDD